MFGARLLAQVHSEAPDKNVVIAPLSLTVLLGAIQSSSSRDEAREEFGRAFGWGAYPDLRFPARMVLAVMEKPKQPIPAKARPGLMWDGQTYEPESLWMENRLLYRSPKAGRGLLDPRFMESASSNFGLQLVSTGERLPSESDLRGSRQSVGHLPPVSPLNQVRLSSGVHMRQSWEKIFMQSEPEPGEFRLQSGEKRKVLRVYSELWKYPHLKNDQFEAVALPCGRVEVTFVLPAPKSTIQELEQFLVTHPDALDGMSTSRYGTVTLTQFEINTTTHLESALTVMGILDIFEHLDGISSGQTFRDPNDFSKGMIPAVNSKVSDLAQSINFGADKHGVHADAETLIGAIPAGILSAPNVFQVSLDRPFVFLVRERTTNALLFAGALMDPGDATTAKGGTKSAR
ncbi:MAG TPA: serpin family protein [Terracidiphilus sp.]